MRKLQTVSLELLDMVSGGQADTVCSSAIRDGLLGRPVPPDIQKQCGMRTGTVSPEQLRDMRERAQRQQPKRPGQ